MKRINCKLDKVYGKCVIDMDSCQTNGGDIQCDTAEDLNFEREKILRHCEYSEEISD